MPASERILVYTTPFCGYCSAAKRLLSSKGAGYTEVDVMMDAERRAEMIERSSGCRTVPQIFIGDRHIGGYDDLSALDSSGELDDLLALNSNPQP
jgi:glutaredoxin 3